MNLAIDIGNSRTKTAVFDNYELVELMTEEFLDQEFLDMVFSRHAISRCIISTVAGHNESLIANLKERTDLLMLTEHTPLPLKNLYKSKSTLGKDRLAAAIGASTKFKNQNLLVVDFGTCLTYDLIKASGEFLGGNISPGINMRFKALNQFTSDLPLLQPAPVDYSFGTDTKQSIMSGVMNGMKAEFSGTIERYEQEFDDLKVIITGGDSAFFETTVKSNIFAVPNLVLEGLNKILQHNAI